MNTLVTCIRFDGSGFPCTSEHKMVQEWALRSWAELNLKVVMLNKIGQVYVKELVEELCNYDVAAQIDGDIIITKEIIDVFDFISKQEVPSMATSHRYNFDVQDYPDLSKANVSAPYGVSLFIANRLFWNEYLKVVEPTLSRLGETDDSAILSYGNKYYPNSTYDFTNLRCVFHPNHGVGIVNRRDFNQHTDMDVSECGIPGNKWKLL